MLTDFIVSMVLKFVPANDVGLVAILIVGISWLIIAIDHALAATNKIKANSTWEGVVGIANFLFKKEEKVLQAQQIVSTTALAASGPGSNVDASVAPGNKTQNFGAAGDSSVSPKNPEG